MDSFSNDDLESTINSSNLTQRDKTPELHYDSTSDSDMELPFSPIFGQKFVGKDANIDDSNQTCDGQSEPNFEIGNSQVLYDNVVTELISTDDKKWYV